MRVPILLLFLILVIVIVILLQRAAPIVGGGSAVPKPMSQAELDALLDEYQICTRKNSSNYFKFNQPDLKVLKRDIKKYLAKPIK